MGLKVIGAGFGRTGTMSLKVALEELGVGKCHHMIEVIRNPETAEHIRKMKGATLADWDKLLSDYDAAVDWPLAAFYEDLMRLYPDAKVILTERDPERWYSSMFDTVHVGKREGSGAATWPMFEELIWKDVFDGRFDDKEHAIRVFKEHNAKVKATVVADRLLVFKPEDGWKPLCQFMGLPVPEGPFPHVNDKETFLKRRALAHAARKVQGVPHAVSK